MAPCPTLCPRLLGAEGRHRALSRIPAGFSAHTHTLLKGLGVFASGQHCGIDGINEISGINHC